MGFFGRLTNLGKGWASGLTKRGSTAPVEAEMERDRLNPTPGPAAEAQLAALKSGSAKGQQSEASGSAADTEASEPSEQDNESPPKKTL
jgi:hypothetical protein